MQKEDELLKVQDVAVRLHVNARTILRMVERGELDAVKMTRGWRFRPQDIDAYLRKHHTGSMVATTERDIAGDEPTSNRGHREPLRPLTLLDLEKQRLELEKEQLELERERVELDTRRIDYVLETTKKMATMPEIDDKTKAKLLETLLPRLLELGNGRSERGLHPSKQNGLELRSVSEIDGA